MSDLPSDFKPAWDPKKHDAKIPHKPDVVTVKCPKCREEGYWVPLHNIDVTFQGPMTAVNLGKPQAFLCSHCNQVVGAAIMVNSARKSLGVATAQVPTKIRQ